MHISCVIVSLCHPFTALPHLQPTLAQASCAPHQLILHCALPWGRCRVNDSCVHMSSCHYCAHCTSIHAHGRGMNTSVTYAIDAPPACKAAICPGNPYPGISRIAGGRSRISVREYPSRRRTSYLVDGCHERGPRSTARCTASSWYSHKCASIRFGRAPIWRLHGGSTTANHERRLSSRSAAGPPQREP